MYSITDLIALITALTASLALLIKLISISCYRSKCTKLKFCNFCNVFNCLESERDVGAEGNTELNFDDNNNVQHHETKPQEVHISIQDNKSVVERSPNIQIRQLDKE